MTKIRYTRIQRFCLHDGPGIRTTVFLFGCGLRCPWCCNPENLIESKAFPVLEANPEELAEELLRDQAYFGEDGGVTFSGGEPLLQAEALVPVWNRLHENGVHLAIETSLFADSASIELACKHADLLIVDFKPKLHLADGGESCVIDEFYTRMVDALSVYNLQIWVRTVDLQGLVTDKFLNDVRCYATTLGAQRIEVLPEHDLGKAKRILGSSADSAMGSSDINIVYSFDIFDTLVTRCVKQPAGLFRCVLNSACKRGVFCPDSYPEDRIAAEVAARRSSDSEEVTLEEIYCHFNEDYDIKTLNALKTLEEQAEVDLAVPIKRTVAKLRELVAGGDRVVLVSDMYLPKYTIERILKSCGISGYEGLYLSSEIGLRKSSGNLFSFVLDDLDIPANHLLHVGDDDHADSSVPKTLGIAINDKLRLNLERRTFIRRARNRLNKRHASDLDFRALSDDELANHECEIGYSILGPLLYAFCNWLHEESLLDGVDSLYFVARDGLVIKRAYEILFPDANTHYLYGSRRAMTVPLLCRCESLADAISHVGLDRASVTVESLVNALGIDISSVRDQMELFGLRPTEQIDMREVAEREALAGFYDSIKEIVNENAADEDLALSSYIEETFANESRVGFVDIGWSGSTQRAIVSKCADLGLDVEVFGYYTGLRPSPGKDVDYSSAMKGFLFDFDTDSRVLARQGIYNALYETFFSAQHGTVLRFVFERGRSVPVLAPYEFQGSEFGDVIKQLQSAALAFVGDAKHHNLKMYFEFTPKNLLAAFDKLGINPSSEEAELFGSAPFLDYGMANLATPMRISDALMHPSDFADDLEACYWKPAYLKRMLKLPLPYGEIIAKVKEGLRSV